MDGIRLQDLIYRGSGKAAAAAGSDCDLYRPTSAFDPLDASNRIMRLPVAFLPVGGRFRRPVPLFDPYWEAVLDGAYVQPGDILKRRTDNAIFFIAARQPMLPVLCVRALRTVSLARPNSAHAAGLNLYGGVIAGLDISLAANWPASFEIIPSPGTGSAGLQAELVPSSWQVLLPASLKLSLQVSDILADDEGRNGIIAIAETTDLGTRLTVKQAST